MGEGGDHLCQHNWLSLVFVPGIRFSVCSWKVYWECVSIMMNSISCFNLILNSFYLFISADLQPASVCNTILNRDKGISEKGKSCSFFCQNIRKPWVLSLQTTIRHKSAFSYQKHWHWVGFSRRTFLYLFSIISQSSSLMGPSNLATKKIESYFTENSQFMYVRVGMKIDPLLLLMEVVF